MPAVAASVAAASDAWANDGMRDMAEVGDTGRGVVPSQMIQVRDVKDG